MISGVEALENAPYSLNRAKEVAKEACDKLAASFPEWDIRSHACLGSPASEILIAAESWKPDLIVVGSHGHSALGRFVFGSVSQKVVTEAHCSVRIARNRREERKELPLNILIGFDGSPDAIAAVRAVSSRHWPKESEARIYTALDTPSSSETTRVNELKGLINSAMEAELRADGLKVSFYFDEGSPKKHLVEEAEKWPADAIFIGSRGLGRLKRFLLGSVSSAVAARSSCSVEVVRVTEQ
jgi:nucleotide-binding universal stress UspA family protein